MRGRTWTLTSILSQFAEEEARLDASGAGPLREERIQRKGAEAQRRRETIDKEPRDPGEQTGLLSDSWFLGFLIVVLLRLATGQLSRAWTQASRASGHYEKFTLWQPWGKGASPILGSRIQMGGFDHDHIDFFTNGYPAAGEPLSSRWPPSVPIGLWQLSPGPSVSASPVHDDITQSGLAPASFADVIAAVKPAVVNIATSARLERTRRSQGAPFPPGSPFEEFFRRFGDPRAERERPTPRVQGAGSGFLIDPDGYVVTNHHVVEGAEGITVTLDDGRRFEAELVGSDVKTDLAVLKVDTDEALPYASFGSSDETRVGDWVIAIGNPFGLGGTATTGIVSARGRDIQAGPYDDFLQIDAPINSGNSGGPLFDLNGRVVGINTAIYSPNGGSVGIGLRHTGRAGATGHRCAAHGRARGTGLARRGHPARSMKTSPRASVSTRPKVRWSRAWWKRVRRRRLG